MQAAANKAIQTIRKAFRNFYLFIPKQIIFLLMSEAEGSITHTKVSFLFEAVECVLSEQQNMQFFQKTSEIEQNREVRDLKAFTVKKCKRFLELRFTATTIDPASKNIGKLEVDLHVRLGKSISGLVGKYAGVTSNR